MDTGRVIRQAVESRARKARPHGQVNGEPPACKSAIADRRGDDENASFESFSVPGLADLFPQPES